MTPPISSEFGWPASTWKEFCEFLKENVSPAKLHIANIGQKLHSVKQRAIQTVPQLIAYIEALEWQWPETLPDSVRANYLTQALHEYIRKELGRREVDMSSRKAMEEAALSIENIEEKPAHLRKGRAKEPPSDGSKKRKRQDSPNKEASKDRLNAAFPSDSKHPKKKDGKKRKGKRDISPSRKKVIRTRDVKQTKN